MMVNWPQRLRHGEYLEAHLPGAFGGQADQGPRQGDGAVWRGHEDQGCARLPVLGRAFQPRYGEPAPLEGCRHEDQLAA